MTTCVCGAEIVQPSRGRRRLQCEACSPRRDRPERRAPVLAMSKSPEVSGRRSLTERTLAELEEAGRVETWQGEAALALAEMFDAGGYTAQGAAALVRAHREALDLALRGAGASADIIDLIFSSGP